MQARDSRAACERLARAQEIIPAPVRGARINAPSVLLTATAAWLGGSTDALCGLSTEATRVETETLPEGRFELLLATRGDSSRHCSNAPPASAPLVECNAPCAAPCCAPDCALEHELLSAPSCPTVPGPDTGQKEEEESLAAEEESLAAEEERENCVGASPESWGRTSPSKPQGCVADGMLPCASAAVVGCAAVASADSLPRVSYSAARGGNALASTYA